jgi:hypothetical protein
MARLPLVDVDARNHDLARYTDAMRRVAERRGVVFVDVYAPTRRLMEVATSPLTVNGIHLSESGDRAVAQLLLEGLGLDAGMREATAAQLRDLEALRSLIRDKNQQFFFRFRPLNAEYVVGRRVEPFGSVNLPGEMKKLDEIVAGLDRQIWKKARALQGVRYGDTAAGTTSTASRN